MAAFLFRGPGGPRPFSGRRSNRLDLGRFPGRLRLTRLVALRAMVLAQVWVASRRTKTRSHGVTPCRVLGVFGATFWASDNAAARDGRRALFGLERHYWR